MAVGNLVKIGPDNLTLVDAEGGVVLELPRTSITRVEVSHQTRATKKGLLLGMGVGAAAVALAIAVGPGSGEPLACGGSLGKSSHPCTSGEKVGMILAGLAVWGGIGAWIGSGKKTDHWKDARMEDWMASGRALTWQVSPTLSRGGHGAGLRTASHLVGSPRPNSPWRGSPVWTWHRPPHGMGSRQLWLQRNEQQSCRVGLLGGASVGAFVKTEPWKEVDSGPKITLTLPKRGIGAQVSVGW